MRFRYAIAAQLFFVVPTLQATETRFGTLQSIGGVQDETRVFDYPAQLNNYQIALIELGTAGNTEVYGGAFMQYNDVSLGASLSRDNWLFTSGRLGSTYSTFDRFTAGSKDPANDGPFLPSPKRPIELLFGSKIDGSSSWAARLAIANDKDSEKGDTAGVESKDSYSADHVQLGFGYRMALEGVINFGLNLDVSAQQKHDVAVGGASTTHSIKGKNNIDFKVLWLASEKSSGPYVEGQLGMRKFDAKASVGGSDKKSSFDESFAIVEGGYAYLPTQYPAKLYAGVAVMNSKSKGPTLTGTGAKAVPSYTASDDKLDIQALVTSAAFSGEGEIWNSFGAMVGVNYALWGNVREKDNISATKTKIERSVTETSDANFWSLGLYYTSTRLRVDASYSKSFLHNGPYFVSGNQTNPMLSRISASYAF